MNENPFYHLRDLEQVEWFYNRQSEVRDALDILRAFETVRAKGTIEVTGPRRIGRTWFLRYISHPTILQEHRIDPQRSICAYTDCQRLTIHQEKAQVYQRMLECIVDAARRVGVDLIPEPREGPFHRLLAAIRRIFRRKTVNKTPESGKVTVLSQDLHAPPGDGYSAGMAFEQALQEMHRRGLRTILLLDEFEAMARNPNLDVSFFNHLRALASADDVSVTYVVASATPLVDLALERESLVGSPFFNIFQPIPLGLFSERDSQHLVEDTLRRAGTSFPRDLLGLVLEVGGRHPFFLQMAGHHAFKLAVAGDELTDDQRKAFLENVHREATRHFEFYWEHLTQREQYVLAALPVTQGEETYQEELASLTNLCLIVKERGQNSYFSPLFRDFVRRQEVSNILQVGPLVLVLPLQRVLLRENLLPLSRKLFTLLKYLMERPGQVVSNEELDREVMASPEEQQEYEYFGDERLKSTVKRLRKALGSDADCIVNEPGEGYILQIQTEEQVALTWTATVTEGERRKATVLFADVVGFTPLTEEHEEEILTIMQPALRLFVDAVDQFGGKVINFGGDSITALFGVPTERPDDAIRAVRAALEVQANVAAYARELKQAKDIDFSVRIGLDTGVVVLGEIGGKQRTEHTAMGDVVNLAQRLKAVAEPATIVISDHTYQQVRGRFKIESLGRVQVKGKSGPVEAYRVLEENGK